METSWRRMGKVWEWTWRVGGDENTGLKVWVWMWRVGGDGDTGLEVTRYDVDKSSGEGVKVKSRGWSSMEVRLRGSLFAFS